MFTYISGTRIWRPEKVLAGFSANIWNLHWLSWRLIVSTEQTFMYISLLPNAVTPKKAQNHDIITYFSTNLIVAFCHAPP